MHIILVFPVHIKVEVVEKVQQSRTHTALVEDISLVPSNQHPQLTIAYNFSSRRSSTLSGLHRHIHSHAHIPTYIIKNEDKLLRSHREIGFKNILYNSIISHSPLLTSNQY